MPTAPAPRPGNNPWTNTPPPPAAVNTCGDPTATQAIANATRTGRGK